MEKNKNKRDEKDDEWNEQMRKKRNSEILWGIMLLVAISIFAFSSYRLCSIFGEYKEGTEQYVDVSNQVVNKPTEPPVLVEEKEVLNEEGEIEKPYSNLPEYPAPEVDFVELKGINADVIGWIEVEAIPSISYPIVQGQDNDYYLKRTIYKKKNSAGSIFVDYTNSSTFSDCNTIIYGHNMKNGSMFGQLSDLYEQDKYKKSHYIWICTPKGKYRYEIFSMQYAPVNSKTYTFYQEHGEEFLQYLTKMVSISVVDFQTEYLSEDDSIITLSTCTSDKNTRFVVQARWIATY